MPALGAHRHSGTDPRNSQRARRVALACEVVSEDHITRSKTARGAIADPDFHLPHENKNVLSPGRGVPVAPIVRRETAEHAVGTRLKCNVVALLGRQREIFKMGLAVVARIYPYDHARAPSHREIIVHHRAAAPTLTPAENCLGRRSVEWRSGTPVLLPGRLPARRFVRLALLPALSNGSPASSAALWDHSSSTAGRRSPGPRIPAPSPAMRPR